MQRKYTFKQSVSSFSWLRLIGIILITTFFGSFQDLKAQLDVGITALVAPASPVCPALKQTITVALKNYDASTIDFAVSNVTITVNITGASTQSFNTLLTSGTLAAGASQNVDVTLLADLSHTGVNSFDAWPQLPAM
jgi:hypothetical protein